LIGRGFIAMLANAVRLLVSGAGLAAVYWFGLGVAGLFAAIAAGFCTYAALTALAVVRISPPHNNNRGMTASTLPPDVRFGSKADICSAVGNARSTPNGGHVQCKRKYAAQDGMSTMGSRPKQPLQRRL